jgi:hypothetical protein
MIDRFIRDFLFFRRLIKRKIIFQQIKPPVNIQADTQRIPRTPRNHATGCPPAGGGRDVGERESVFSVLGPRVAAGMASTFERL